MTTDALLVDIGGDAGALIVYAPDELIGAEIEIARADTPPRHPVHNVVRARQVGDEVVCAAVFPALPAGTYVRWGEHRTLFDASAFTVVGGRVTELDWTATAWRTGPHACPTSMIKSASNAADCRCGAALIIEVVGASRLVALVGGKSSYVASQADQDDSAVCDVCSGPGHVGGAESGCGRPDVHRAPASTAVRTSCC
jgi:hypothetical protein